MASPSDPGRGAGHGWVPIVLAGTAVALVAGMVLAVLFLVRPGATLDAADPVIASPSAAASSVTAPDPTTPADPVTAVDSGPPPVKSAPAPDPIPSAEPTAAPLTSLPPDPVPRPTPRSRLAAPATEPVTVDVVRGSAGVACRPTDEESSYGSYPLARCTMWRESVGRTTGKPLRKGRVDVTCQRNLKLANPAYSAGQSNTWWIWAPASSGIWDWFPETAVAQGASDQPINGIARCQ